MNEFIMLWNEILKDTSLSTEEAVFYCYLESVEDYSVDKKIIDGKRYTRISYDMLIDRFRTVWRGEVIPMSREKIDRMFKKLVERKYIEKTNMNFTKGSIYYRCITNYYIQHKHAEANKPTKSKARGVNYADEYGVTSKTQSI